MPKRSILTHSLSNQAPTFAELAVGELALWIQNNEVRLFTKNFEGHILEVGKGVRKFADLQDVDFTNATEGSFFTKQGDKFVATNTVGSITRISDVEITDPQDGEYLRYDSTYQAFRNSPVTYALYQLTDVEAADPSDEEASLAQQNHVLVYDHTDGKYKTTPLS